MALHLICPDNFVLLPYFPSQFYNRRIRCIFAAELTMHDTMKQKLGLILIVSLLAISCSRGSVAMDGDHIPKAPDYALSTAWFGGTAEDGCAYDVFYIVPTCVFDWKDSTETVCHYMDPEKPEHRAAVDKPLRLAKGIFASEANFFAPYYRQITIESWIENDSIIEKRFAVAYEDIAAAFHYYLDHVNKGRPFILAGHSQGGKAVIELLKREMDDRLYRRMIAAYPLGYPVHETDVSPYLVSAAGADDTGVFITFNSVSAPDRLPILLSGSHAAINPLNWRTDTLTAPAELHLGTVFIASDGSIKSEQAHMISARLDAQTRALVISGVDPASYYTPSLSKLFPVGNYHVVELNFFYRNLQQNVKCRAASYFNHQYKQPNIQSGIRLPLPVSISSNAR